MELNYDVVRDLMIVFADSKESTGPTDSDLKIFASHNNISIDELGFTLERLHEAGYITGKPTWIDDHPRYFIGCGNLTWNGNQYLDSIRSQSIWKETKKKLIDKGITASFSVITALATAIAKDKLGLN